MKKITFLIGFLLLVSTITVEANNTNKPNSKFGNYGRYHQRPVTFIERNIKFYVYLNGDLDFEINPYRGGYYGATEYYYKGKRKQTARKRFKASGKHQNNRYPEYSNIHYDYYGRINRIGSVFIHYDYYGKVVAVNHITMSYRHYRLIRVGQLRILRGRYGSIRYIGSVKPRHYHYSNYYHDYYYDDDVYEYDDDFFDDDDFEDDYEYFEEDEDYYYYRSKNKSAGFNKNGKKEKKQKIIKRKKPSKRNRRDS